MQVTLDREDPVIARHDELSPGRAAWGVAWDLVVEEVVAAFDPPPLRAVLAVADCEQASGAEVLCRQLVDVEDLAAAHAPLRRPVGLQVDDVHYPAALHRAHSTPARWPVNCATMDIHSDLGPLGLPLSLAA